MFFIVQNDLRRFGIRIVLFIITTGSGLHIAQAQSPYTLRAGREIALTAAPASGLGLSYALQPRLHVFTAADVAALDPARIPRFERFVTGFYSPRARKISDVLLYSSFSLPFFLLADSRIRSDWETNGLIGAELLLSSVALTNLTKELVHRTRPYAYNVAVPLSEKLKRDTRLSFFSGHSSTTAAIAFGTARIWSDYHPDSSRKPLVWAGAAVLPATVAFLRVRSGKHFLTDVALGYTVGALCGYFIPAVHRRPRR